MVTRGVVRGYALACVAAWLIAPCGAMEWFGVEALADIYAILLAMPWSWAMSWLSGPPALGWRWWLLAWR